MTRKTRSSHVTHPVMFEGSLSPLLLGLLLFASLSGSRLGAELAFDGGRPSLSLDGVWQFRTDPDEGAERRVVPRRRAVPRDHSRAWQLAGPRIRRGANRLSHDYQGKAWYRRTITIPADWAGQRVWLHLGGVTAVGEVYVNGQRDGSVDHFVTPFEFDITNLARIGSENVISVQVDSRSGCHDPHRDPIVRPGPVGHVQLLGPLGRPVSIRLSRSEVRPLHRFAVRHTRRRDVYCTSQGDHETECSWASLGWHTRRNNHAGQRWANVLCRGNRALWRRSGRERNERRQRGRERRTLLVAGRPFSLSD